MIPTPPLDDRFLRLIGLITCYWSAIEAQMEFAILLHQKIDPSVGMVITAEMGGRAKWDLLVMFNNEGAFEPKSSKKDVEKLLRRVKRAYTKRNEVAHQVWVPTENPNIMKRKGVRTKGRLRVIDQRVHISQLERTAEFIHSVGLCFSRFMEHQGLRMKNGPKNAL